MVNNCKINAYTIEVPDIVILLCLMIGSRYVCT